MKLKKLSILLNHQILKVLLIIKFIEGKINSEIEIYLDDGNNFRKFYCQRLKLKI